MEKLKFGILARNMPKKLFKDIIKESLKYY